MCYGVRQFWDLTDVFSYLIYLSRALGSRSVTTWPEREISLTVDQNVSQNGFKIVNSSDQLPPPQRNIIIYFMPHFWANYGLIVCGNADFWAFVFFSKNQILGGGADCPIS